jgi:hypothetical protein
MLAQSNSIKQRALSMEIISFNNDLTKNKKIAMVADRTWGGTISTSTVNRIENHVSAGKVKSKF